MRGLIVTLVFLTLATVARAASAQEYLMSGSAEVASGVEGNGSQTGGLGLARTRLRLGLELRVDENPKDIFGGALLAEIEPRAAVGVDLRYFRELGKHWLVDVGVIGFLAPQSLFGPSAGAKYLIPLSSTSAFTLGPEFNVFVIGGDLPSDTVIWQGLLQGGIRVGL